MNKIELKIGQRWQRVPNNSVIIEVSSDLQEDSCIGKVLHQGESIYKIGEMPYCSSFKYKDFWKLLPNQGKP